jgi:BirA family biotin operon repressor/biotin-[acetyl-CoA-carboxylase] ligase
MPFIELESVDSTNNYAFKQLHEGLAHHGTAYFAREQLAGKGQRGKSWSAGKDSSLIMSIIINPQPLSLNQQFQLSALAAVAACQLLRKYTSASVCIKWPNDLYWQDRKAGGILIENLIGGQRSDASSSPDRLNTNRQIITANDQPTSQWLWAVIGIGINVNQTSFGEELRNPVSMKQITGKDFSPVELAKELCQVLDDHLRRLSTFGFEAIYSSYLSFLYKKNESVRLRKGNRAFDATIKAVSPTGRLVVQHAIEEEFDFGEIDWVIPANMPKN